jgi:DNA-binding transcriptional LysR family regulator
VDLGVLFLAEVVTRYTARYPAVSVFMNLTGRPVDLVAEGLDVALRVAPRLADSTLVARKAAAMWVRLFASPLYLARRGTPRDERDLEGHDWVAFRGQGTPRYHRLAGHLYVVSPSVRHVPAKVTAFRDLVLELLRARPLGPAGV